MKISEKLPSFQDGRALLIVLGRQVAKIYEGREREINQLEQITVETPTYSDNEGFFQRSGQGQTYGSGSVLEDLSDLVVQEFTRELANRLPDLLRPPVLSLYVFAPEHMKFIIAKVFPAAARPHIKEEFFGNYVEQHPFDLLRMIQEREEARQAGRRAVPTSASASELLGRSDLLKEAQ